MTPRLLAGAVGEMLMPFTEVNKAGIGIHLEKERKSSLAWPIQRCL